MFLSRICKAFTNNSLNSLQTPKIFLQKVNLSTTGFLLQEQSEGLPEAEEKIIDPSKDRRKIIPVETSIRYLNSKAYKETYGDECVWVPYRRNFPGVYPPPKTRKMCIRNGIISTASPCPICRDEYLVLDYKNIKLIKQFISPYTGEILSYK